MNVEKQTELTLGEQRYLERAREAEKEGASLHAYYRTHGLSLNMLYKVRRQLVAKGIVAPPARAPVSAERPWPGTGWRVSRFCNEHWLPNIPGFSGGDSTIYSGHC